MLADLRAPSYSPAHMSRVLHDEDCKDEDDEYQIVFPLYDNEKDYSQVKDIESPSNNSNSHVLLPILKSTSAITPSLPLPDLFDRAEDDTAIGYSHLDILENALWRTWMKSKNKLNTVCPETINWSKDCDVIWLYGPLQTGTDKSLHLPSSWIASSRISKPNTCLNKKPILKKRSMSDIMLQRSFSSLSLRRQAAATAQAQHSDNRGLICLRTDYRVSNDTVSFSSPGFSQEDTSMLSSISSLGSISPEVGEKKTIRFNEQVEQCISLEIKGNGSKEIYAINDYDDSDSENGEL
ncbi:hypothetical protein BGZ57DRAFT_937011 [Hyaloscypha finlandica]|nr:hypothetical protein BGZ57DRAFT_937011 [Hyaloscypha finlandica]